MTSPFKTGFWSKCTCGRPDVPGADLYHVVIAERANRSIHQLQSALREGDGGVGEGAPDAPCGAGEESEDPGAAWQELQYSHAGGCERTAVLVSVAQGDYFKLLHRVRTPGHLPLCRCDFLPETQISWCSSLAEYFPFDFMVPVGCSPQSFKCHSSVFLRWLQATSACSYFCPAPHHPCCKPRSSHSSPLALLPPSLRNGIFLNLSCFLIFSSSFAELTPL